MATLFEAVASYGPKLVYGRTIELDELAEWTASRSGLSDEEVERALKAVRSAIIHYGRGGAAIRLPGLGRIRPALGRDGKIRVHVISDPEVKRALNAPGAYRGDILNRGRIGLDDAGYKALWDMDHPDDPMDEPRSKAS